jgi:hypothetical protein
MRKRSAKPYDPPNYGPEAVTRRCDATDCAEEGAFRAPKSRDRLNDYFWFCLDHVRQYNKAWNYYADMSAQDVETDIRRSTTWDRPTWPFGTRDGQQSRSQAYRVNDPFGFMDDDDPEESARGNERRGPRGADVNTAEAKAVKLMELQPPLTMERLKRRYKELVKLHHPDANGGDKEAEERLKDINEAYATLRRFLT